MRVKRIRNIEDETPLIPWLIAERLSKKRSVIALLCFRANVAYTYNHSFRAKMKGSYEREWLYTFMEHWHEAIKKRGIRECKERWKLPEK